MIVKMKKMDLLLYHREQEKFLDDLRGLGVVHITSDAPVDSAAAQELNAEIQLAARVASALKRVQIDRNIHASTVAVEDVPRLFARFEDCETKLERVEQEFTALQKDNNTLAPWGNFDPHAVKRLADAGIGMKFCVMPEKKFAALDKSQLGIEVITNLDGFVHFVLVFGGEAPVIAGAEEARLPDSSLKDINAKAAALELRRNEVASDIDTMAGHTAEIEKYRAELMNNLRFEQARLAMTSEADGKLLKLSGWVPQQNEAKVNTFLQDYPAYVTFRDPVSTDEVPIKLKNNAFSRLFEPILKLYSLPGYRELDYTPHAAPFFAFFFGLCLGDAGYGLIFVLASLIGLAKAGPKMKPFMALGLIFGVATTACGVLLNGFFGFPIFGGEAEGITGAILPNLPVSYAPLAALELEGGTDFPAMGLALVIGFVHMFFGMFVYVFTQIRDRGFMAALMPLSLMAMVTGGVISGVHVNFMELGLQDFAVNKWEVGKMLMLVPPDVAKWLAIGGIAGALLFNSLDKIIFIRPLTGLWELYNFTSGFFSNILSYLRLFALGLAGGLLGAAINRIATEEIMGAFGDGSLRIVGIAAMVLIMVGGHALNLALAALGAFVHPLRLTFVEFYGAVKFQGGGKAYAPFAKVEN
jgi:V/A-type H+-transporting ATPase subunit I